MEQSGTQVKRSYDGEHSGTPYRGEVQFAEQIADGQRSAEAAPEEFATTAEGRWNDGDWNSSQWVIQWNANGHEWSEREKSSWRSWWATRDEVPVAPTVPADSPIDWLGGETVAQQAKAEGQSPDEAAAKQREDFRRASRAHDAAESVLALTAPGAQTAAAMATRAKANPKGPSVASRTPTPPRSQSPRVVSFEDARSEEEDEQPRARRRKAEAPTTPSDVPPMVDEPWSTSDADSLGVQPPGPEAPADDDEV